MDKHLPVLIKLSHGLPVKRQLYRLTRLNEMLGKKNVELQQEIASLKVHVAELYLKAVE